MAARTYPVLAKVEPKPFLKILTAGELTVATALLLPVVPAHLAGLSAPNPWRGADREGHLDVGHRSQPGR